MEYPIQTAFFLALALLGTLGSIVAATAEASLLAVQSRRRTDPVWTPDNPLVLSMLDQEDRFMIALRAFDLSARLTAVLALVIVFRILWPMTPVTGFLAAVAISLAVFVIFAEIIPSSLPDESAYTIAMILAPFTYAMAFVMAPIIPLALALDEKVSNQGDNGRSGEDRVIENEMRSMLRLGEIEGVIEEDTRDIIEGIFTFGDRVAADIMTPRVSVFALDRSELEAPAAREVLRRSSFSRALVYDGSMDSVLGMLDCKQALLHTDRSPAALIAEPLYAPTTRRLIDLLADMKRSRIHFAVILDQYGSAVGVVTMGDMLDEIVGELEEDAMGGELIRPGKDGAYMLSGRLDIESLNDRLNLSISEEVAHTVSGYIVEKVGHHPAPGDEVVEEGWRLKVTRMGPRRVAQARLELLAPEAPAETEGTPNGKAKGDR